MNTGEIKKRLEGERDTLVQRIQQMQSQFEADKNHLHQVLGKLELLEEIDGPKDGA